MALGTALQSISRISRSCIWFPNNCSVLGGTQTLRWKKPRKPFSLGTAPSKLFRVTGRKRLPKDQNDEKVRLFNNYDLFMASTRQYLVKISEVGEESELAKQKLMEEEAEDHARLMEYNRKENERLLLIREKRREEEMASQLLRIEEFKKVKKMESEQAYREGLNLIMQTEKIVKDLIHEDNLEEAIEKAMANPTDYNSALDLDGRIYPGRTTKIASMKREILDKLEPHITITSKLRPDTI